jgi:hypothetical protein
MCNTLGLITFGKLPLKQFVDSVRELIFYHYSQALRGLLEPPCVS